MDKDKKSTPKEFITKFGYKWYSDGTCGKKEGLLIVFMGEEEILNLFDYIEKKLGQSINKLLCLAKRIVTVNVINQEFVGRLMKFLIRVRLISDERLKNVLNEKLLVPIGWGFCEKAKINHKEKSGFFQIKNYPSKPLIEGAVSGLIQYVFNLSGVNIKSKEEKNKILIWVTPEEKEDELAKYILKPVRGVELGLLPGDIKYEFLEKGTPAKLFEAFEWQLDKGLILDRRTKEHKMLFTRYALDATFHILKRELGSDFISETIFEAEKDYIKNLLKNIDKEARKELLTKEEFGLNGWGYLKKIKKEGNGYNIVVYNPFNHEIISGFISGFFEIKEGKEFKTRWYGGKNNILEIELKS